MKRVKDETYLAQRGWARLATWTAWGRAVRDDMNSLIARGGCCRMPGDRFSLAARCGNH